MKLAATLVLGVSLSLLPLARPLTPETFGVEAGSYRTFGFEISRFGRVFGQFRTQYGKGSEIRVLVVDQDQFENFRTGREFRPYYDSGRVSEGQIDFQLRYGRYVLIFDNRSSYSNRTVASNLQLDES